MIVFLDIYALGFEVVESKIDGMYSSVTGFWIPIDKIHGRDSTKGYYTVATASIAHN